MRPPHVRPLLPKLTEKRGVCSRVSYTRKCSIGKLGLLIKSTTVLCAGQYVGANGEAQGDVFYFDYGVVAFWGLEKLQVSCPTSLLFPKA